MGLLWVACCVWQRKGGARERHAGVVVVTLGSLVDDPWQGHGEVELRLGSRGHCCLPAAVGCTAYGRGDKCGVTHPAMCTMWLRRSGMEKGRNHNHATLSRGPGTCSHRG